MPEITAAEAMHRPAPITLSSGETVEIRKVALRDLAAARGLFMLFVAVLGEELGRERCEGDPEEAKPAQPTEEEIAEWMPLALADRHAAGDEGALALLSLVSGVTQEQLDSADLGDIEALWEACYRANRLPFERQRKAMGAEAIAGVLAMLRSDASASSSPPSSGPDSTQETQTSPPSGRSTSRRGSRSGSGARGTKKLS